MGKTPWLLLGCAIALLIITSAYLRTQTQHSTLAPSPDVSIKCTTEPAAPIEETPEAEPVVFIAQAAVCPTHRQQAVHRLRSLYRAHLEEVRCG